MILFPGRTLKRKADEMQCVYKALDKCQKYALNSSHESFAFTAFTEGLIPYDLYEEATTPLDRTMAARRSYTIAKLSTFWEKADTSTREAFMDRLGDHVRKEIRECLPNQPGPPYNFLAKFLEALRQPGREEVEFHLTVRHVYHALSCDYNLTLSYLAMCIAEEETTFQASANLDCVVEHKRHICEKLNRSVLRYAQQIGVDKKILIRKLEKLYWLFQSELESAVRKAEKKERYKRQKTDENISGGEDVVDLIGAETESAKED